MFQTRHQRAFWLQAAIGAALIAAALLLVRAIHISLEARGLSSGFAFLERSTGWDVAFSLIPYTPADPYWRVLLVGLLNTVFLGAIGLSLATLIGIAVGILRISKNPVIAFLGTAYVELLRNVPLILQVFFWYAIFIHLPRPREAVTVLEGIILTSRGVFLPGLNLQPGIALAAAAVFLGLLLAALVLALLPRPSIGARIWLPRAVRACLLGAVLGAGALLWAGRMPEMPFIQVAYLKGLNFRGGIRLSPELAALITAIALYGGAFIGEIIRAGFLAVGHGQIEAAQALGLGPWKVMARVRLPLALRSVLPTLTNQYVWLLKATTMGIVVGFSDLFLVISTAINQSGQTLELIGILMAGFLILNNALAAAMNLVNRRIALRGTQIRT
ncbi:ABC transporter permease subunit [Poseidonocella sp. HB161398]|uniref:ABC transporter permease subunit n=1 Tax=Poseidonocella sp. HB161398 TaxID=2320855 RepID=UPI001107CA55|nr:ABC transporter permease subunit [Poseidonocella sp. HB161398]